jgi:hypothetical protein
MPDVISIELLALLVKQLGIGKICGRRGIAEPEALVDWFFCAD